MPIPIRGGWPALLVAVGLLAFPVPAGAEDHGYSGDATNSRLTEVHLQSTWHGDRVRRIRAFRADHIGMTCSDGTSVRTGRSIAALPRLSGPHVSSERRFNGRLHRRTANTLVQAKLKGGFHSDTDSAFGWVHYRVDYFAKDGRDYVVCRSKRLGWKAHR
jgi:hypothetical protein